MLALATSIQAIYVCDQEYLGSNPNPCADMETSCVLSYIGVGDTINVPNTQCVWNDQRSFDAWVCDGLNGGGDCTKLSQLPYFNFASKSIAWDAPNTQSIVRIY